MLFPDGEDNKGKLNIEPVEHTLPSLKNQVKSFVLAKRTIGAFSDSGSSALRALSRAQSFIRLEVFTNARQFTLTEFCT